MLPPPAILVFLRTLTTATLPVDAAAEGATTAAVAAAATATAAVTTTAIAPVIAPVIAPIIVPIPPPPPPELVDLAEVAPGIAIDMRYAGAQNFLGRPARGYAASRCLLTRAAARALALVAADLAQRGLGLRVYDCFRPQRAVDDFVAWAQDAADQSTRARHYPAVPKRELFHRGYIAERSGHTRGSTVDLTLFSLAAASSSDGSLPEPADCRVPSGAAVTADGTLDMGTAFDCFDERAHAAYAGVSALAQRHRRWLREAMLRRGFAPYAKEWWHFTLAVEPFPHRYFDFEIR